MSPLQFSLMRVEAFTAEIARLKQVEFPYPHSQNALDELANLFDKRQQKLCDFDAASDPATVSRECELALRDLFQYTHILGFILRSTNVRNAFEVYRPLLRMARAVLEPTVDDSKRTTKLLLSSEWHYSPLMYPELPDLKGFVLIGLPAPESNNPFLVPLAGHELGHSLWAKEQYASKIRPNISRQVVSTIQKRWDEFQRAFPHLQINRNDLSTSLFAIQIWNTAVQNAVRQAEESFCDFVGIRIFGTSYLNAFAYLLSPNISGPRSTSYPKMGDRIADVVKASNQYGISVDADYQSLFQDNVNPNFAEGDIFLLSVADEARQAVVPTLIRQADEVVREAKLPDSSDDEVKRIIRRFKQVVPAEDTRAIADILNAGWVALNDPDLWREMPHINSHKNGVIKELVLKNIEVYEIEQIMKEVTL